MDSKPSTQGTERLNVLKNELQQLTEKVAEVELERDEHHVVLETLKSMSSDRICFRQLDDILLESTVGQVIPMLEEQCKQIDNIYKQLDQQKQSKQRELLQHSRK